MIELRSDTFTLPSAAMLQAMREAQLGDDVYAEDPTVNKLEELAAKTVGKEAACFMPSGTMGNLAALLVHAPRGSKILVGSESDIFLYEAGGAAICGGVIYDPVSNQSDGTLSLSDLASRFPADVHDPQFALPALICIENTQNRCGGRVLAEAYLEALRDFATERSVAVHMDGARLFNAAVASGKDPAVIAQYADSVQFCISKGLGAPIGSLLAGSADFVRRARRIRKMLGGGMRQGGIVAAAGIIGIETYSRLAEDHANARAFADGLSTLPGIAIDASAVETNIVLFSVTDRRFTWQTFLVAASERGLALTEFGYGRLRAVTHSGVSRDDIVTSLAIVRDLLAS